MGKIRVLLFDAGNTLIFPHVEQFARDLSALGYNATPEDFYRAERTGKRELDEWLWPQLREGRAPRNADFFYWTAYLRALMEIVSVPKEKQQEVGRLMGEGFKAITAWPRVFPETPAYLQTLRRRGYTLGVISNSLGLIEAQLGRAGLAGHFEFILDSHWLGVEKPHPHIFNHALIRCGCAPSEAIFIGDLYSTDVGGARNAGLHAVLIDWVGAYPEAESPRIAFLPELDRVLAALESES